jgi:putative acyl-CoA dehydrogenase
MSATHDVVNQSTPFTDVDLFATNRPLRDALVHHAPALDATRLAALGVLAGSAEMQAHARLANVNQPQLQTHDRHGRRIDQVEFHPSYHALIGAAMRFGLHGTPWSVAALSHVERAAGFMLFTELEPSVLCPPRPGRRKWPPLPTTRAFSPWSRSARRRWAWA